MENFLELVKETCIAKTTIESDSWQGLIDMNKAVLHISAYPSSGKTTLFDLMTSDIIYGKYRSFVFKGVRFIEIKDAHYNEVLYTDRPVVLIGHALFGLNHMVIGISSDKLRMGDRREDYESHLQGVNRFYNQHIDAELLLGYGLIDCLPYFTKVIANLAVGNTIDQVSRPFWLV